jgi:hypothetical protein
MKRKAYPSMARHNRPSEEDEEDTGMRPAKAKVARLRGVPKMPMVQGPPTQPPAYNPKVSPFGQAPVLGGLPAQFMYNASAQLMNRLAMTQAAGMPVFASVQGVQGVQGRVPMQQPISQQALQNASLQIQLYQQQQQQLMAQQLLFTKRIQSRLSQQALAHPGQASLLQQGFVQQGSQQPMMLYYAPRNAQVQEQSLVPNLTASSSSSSSSSSQQVPAAASSVVPPIEDAAVGLLEGLSAVQQAPLDDDRETVDDV